MGIPLYDPKESYEQLKHHMGHRIVVVGYGDENDPANVAIECESCGEVLLDFDNPNMKED